jgi:UDP-N-acetylglucosamine 3-dehydrogenase
MNVALVGTGTITETKHLPILRSVRDVNIVAICDSNKKRLQRVADSFKIENTYEDIDDMLKYVDIDVVDLATPGFTHFEIARKVISADINLLVEKPATLKAKEAEYLEVESKKRGLKLGVCQNYRYSDPVTEFQKIRECGGIGSIDRIITIQHGSTIFAMPPWFWDENKSGGILFELGIHAIDLQCYLMGQPEAVLNVCANYDKTLSITTSILATIRFKSGIGVVDLKWFSSSQFFHHYVSGSVADAIIKFYPDSLVVQRGEFSPLSESTGEFKRLWNFGYSLFRKKFVERSQLPHRIIIENFIESVNKDSQPLVPMSSVIPTVRLLEDIWAKATREGRI